MIGLQKNAEEEDWTDLGFENRLEYSHPRWIMWWDFGIYLYIVMYFKGIVIMKEFEQKWWAISICSRFSWQRWWCFLYVCYQILLVMFKIEAYVFLIKLWNLVLLPFVRSCGGKSALVCMPIFMKWFWPYNSQYPFKLCLYVLLWWIYLSPCYLNLVRKGMSNFIIHPFDLHHQNCMLEYLWGNVEQDKIDCNMNLLRKCIRDPVSIRHHKLYSGIFIRKSLIWNWLLMSTIPWTFINLTLSVYTQFFLN